MARDGGDRAGLDDLARDLASGSISRRTALRRLAAGALGLGLAGAPSALADGGERACPDSRKCGKKCCPKGAKCKQGKCKCKGGRVKCRKRCCAPGEVCEGGECKSPCGGGETLCGDFCVDLDNDAENCGACGNPCAGNESCVDGGCEPTPECDPGQTQPCYTGPPGTLGVGICQGGTSTCQNDGTWGPCDGETTPQQEICDGIDNDCDGTVDEDFNVGGGCLCDPETVGTIQCDGLGGATCVCA